MKLEDLRVKIFADGADLTNIRQLATLPYIKGFTTNPTLMRKAGVEDYERWARCVLEAVPDKPVSFEVLSDDFTEMERQARKIASWGKNVYVKIPISNTKGDESTDLIHRLACENIKVNITAVMTRWQAYQAITVLPIVTPSILSVFAGRVADTGESPKRLVQNIRELIADYPMPRNVELLWASCRELYNIIQADKVVCDIITVPDNILNKVYLLGKDLEQVSLDTVRQFHDDAVAAGYTL